MEQSWNSGQWLEMEQRPSYREALKKSALLWGSLGQGILQTDSDVCLPDRSEKWAICVWPLSYRAQIRCHCLIIRTSSSPSPFLKEAGVRRKLSHSTSTSTHPLHRLLHYSLCLHLRTPARGCRLTDRKTVRQTHLVICQLFLHLSHGTMLCNIR